MKAKKVSNAPYMKVEKASKGYGVTSTSAFNKKGGTPQGNPCCHTKLD